VFGSGGELPRVVDVTDRALLGLHPAIALPSGTKARLSADMPTYVARDIDPEVRAAVAPVTTKGGFLLLLGTAADGKTHCLYEAVRAVLPNWRMRALPTPVADLGVVRVRRRKVLHGLINEYEQAA
jgi:hypothetical protein